LPERQRARPRALHLHVPPRRHARVLDRDVAGRRAVGTVHHRALREQEEGRRLRKRRSRSMRHARLLVVVLVGALAAAAWWLLDSRATDAVDGASGVAALDPERDSAALRAGGDAEGDEEQATATERTALTVGNAPAAGEGAGPFGYVGHVVDAAGQPVAGATVYLTPWPVASWSGVDAKSATDPDRWAETLRKTIAARVTGQTAADGTFRIPAPAVKGVSCGVRVTARGHQVLNQTV